MFKFFIDFSEAVRTSGTVLIKEGSNVVESFDIQTGEGSLGGGVTFANMVDFVRNGNYSTYDIDPSDQRNDGGSLAIDPGFTFKASTQYTIELVGVKDASGNELALADRTMTFTTASTDTIAPTLVAWNLAEGSTAFTDYDATGTNGQTGVLVGADIIFKASESLVPKANGSFEIREYNTSNAGAVIETFSWTTVPTANTDGTYTITGSLGGTLTISGQTVTINPGQNLEYGTSYSVYASNLEDPNGNAFDITAYNSMYFTTATETTTVQTASGASGGIAVENVTTAKTDEAITINFLENVVAGRTAVQIAGGAAEQYISVYNRDDVLVEKFAVSTGEGSLGGSLTFDGKSISMNVFGGLDYATGYYVTVDEQAIRAGNENVNEPTPVTAFSFDGDGDFVDLGTLQTSGTMTVEAWVKFDDLSQDFMRVYDFNNGVSVDDVILFVKDGGLRAEVRNGDGTTWNGLETASDILVEGEWAHIAVTYDGVQNGVGTVKIYVNGEVVAEDNSIYIPEDLTRTNNWLGQSSHTTNEPYLDGAITDFRVWTDVRTAEEINANMYSLSTADAADTSLIISLDGSSTTNNGSASTTVTLQGDAALANESSLTQESERFYTADNMGNASTPLFFATEAGSQIDPGWITRFSIDADGVAAGDNYVAGTNYRYTSWNNSYADGHHSAPFPGQINTSNNGYGYNPYLRAGEWAGLQVEAAGDVDGDGIMDFIFGSDNKVYDPTKIAGDDYVYGKYYLVFGAAGDWNSVVNYETLVAENRVVEFYGTEGNWLKNTVEFGDLNNDGYNDLLVTVGGNHVDNDGGSLQDNQASNDGDTDSGATFVIYGQARNAWLSDYDVTQLGQQGLQITGGLPQEQFGFSAASGDFNLDGTIDMVFGMPRNDRDGYSSGEGFVINGGDYTDSLMSTGTPVADMLLGDYNADRIAGSSGNDTIYGLGGADIIRGGEGDDVIGLTDLDFILLDGGTNNAGGDTLEFIGNGYDLDMTGYAGQSLRSFERIDLTGDGDNAITINYREMLYLLERPLSTSYGENTELTIDGNSGDKVTLEGPWARITSDATYDYYALDGMVVKIDADITVETEGWTIPFNGATIDFNADVLPDGLRVDTVIFNGNIDQQADTSFVTVLGDVNNDGFIDFAVSDANTQSGIVVPRVFERYTLTNDLRYGDAYFDNLPYVGGYNIYTETSLRVREDGRTDSTGSTGSVTVILGQAGGLGAVHLNQLSSDGIKLTSGAIGGDEFADNMSSLGDIDGDGVADFVVFAQNDETSFTYTEGNEAGTDNDLFTYGVSDRGDVYSSVETLDLGNTILRSADTSFDDSDNQDSWATTTVSRQYFFLGGNTTLVNGTSGDINTYTVTDENGNAVTLPSSIESGADWSSDLPDTSEDVATTRYDINLTDSAADLVALGTQWDPVPVGDVNADGYDDFITTESTGDLIFGQPLPNGIDVNVNWTTIDLGGFNSVTSAGDIDGDGITDMLLSDGGHTYIVFGKEGEWSSINLSSGTVAETDNSAAVVRITKDAEATNNPQYIYSSLGDINGDGYADILIAGNPNDNYGLKSNGAAYVLFGAAEGDSQWNSDISLTDLAENGLGFRITGALDYDKLANSSWTGVGDMNGDGYDDFIIQSSGDAESQNGTSGSGSSYLLLGQATSNWDDVNTIEVQEFGIQILGTGTGEWSALGDVDGDGLADVSISNQNSTSIFYGSTALSATRDESWSALGNATDTVQQVTGTAASTLSASRGDNPVALYGQDRLIGNIGNDTLIGDGGSDVLLGGAGDDRLSIADTNFFRLDGGTGIDTLVLDAAMHLDMTTRSSNEVESIEIIELGSNDIQTLTLTHLDVLNMTGDKNTAIDNANYQLGNILVVDGTDNTDVLNLNAANWVDTGDTTTINGGSSSFTIYQASGTNIFVATNVTPVITATTAVSDTSDGTANTLYGDIGADTFNADGGNDTVYAGAGDDTVDGGADRDYIVGAAGNDSLTGGSENDTIIAGTGDDVIDGGSETDTLDYSNAADAITVTYSNATDGTVTGPVSGTDTFSNIEIIKGTTQDDTFVASATGNTFSIINAGQGDDTFTGGAGTDTLDLTGLSGNYDVNFTGTGEGTISYSNYGTDTFTGIDAITSHGSGVIFNNADGVAITGNTSSDNLVYTDFDSAITITFTATGVGSVTGGANVTFTGLEWTRVSSAQDDTFISTGGTNKLTFTHLSDGINFDLSNGTISSAATGNDTITGTFHINGTQGDDTFVSGTGNDTVDGRGGLDILDLSEATGIITAIQNNIFYFNNSGTYTVDTTGLGQDSYRYIDGVILTDFDDSVVTYNHAWVQAGQGDDVITSYNTHSDWHDTIDGGAGDDTINSGDGNDWITGGAGADSLDGGAGAFDVLDYTDASGSINVNLATGAVSSDGEGSADTVTNFENVLGSANNDTIVGSTGNETIAGGAGDDSLDGGDGSDTLFYGLVSNDLTINLNTGAVTGEGNDTVSNFESVVAGTGNDSITGSNGTERVWGNSGDDTFVSGGGFDTFYGGAGDDVFVLTNDQAEDYFYGGSGMDIVDYSAITTDINVTVVDDSFSYSGLTDEPGDQNDRIIGSTVNVNYMTDDVDDRFYGIEGIIGGSGNDTLRFRTDQDVDAENSGGYLSGGAGNDTITGDDRNDTLIGGTGNDSISGSTGDDILKGGAGNDTLDGGGNTDWVDYTDATAGITIDTTATGAQVTDDGDGGEDTLRNIERIRGSANGDEITVSNQSVDGGAGADTLVGSGDNDTIYVRNTESAVNVNLAAGTMRDQFGDTDSISGFEGAMTGAGNDTIVGSEDADRILAGDGNDNVNAGDGDDTVIVNAGNDTLTGGAGNDTLDFRDGEYSNQAVSLDLSSSSAVSTGRGDKTITGFEHIITTNGEDTVVGGTVAETIETGLGADSVTAGSGDDSILGGDQNDTLSGGAGNDTLEGGNHDDSIVGDAGEDSLLGGSGTDTLRGGDDNDVIDGGADNDLVFGDAGDDTLSGGAGSDTIHGGAGNDRFTHDAEGVDEYYGDAGDDTLTINHYSSNANNHVSFDGGSGIDTVILADDGQTYDLDDSAYNRFSTIEVIELNQTNQMLELDSVAVQTFATSDNNAVDNTDYDGKTLLVVSNTGTNNRVNLKDAGWVVTGDTTTIAGGTETYTILQFGSENIYVALNTVVTVFGNNGNDSIIGTSADESIDGGIGNDTILGLGGNDTIIAGRGDDSVDGGDGIDELRFSTTSNITVDLNQTTAQNTGEGNDIFVNFEQVQGGDGRDLITGSAIAETLKGGDGLDTIDGGAGNDEIYGEAERDSLLGGDGDDSIFGGALNDTIVGGTGADSLDGGAENDIIKGGDGNDTITDTSAGTNSGDDTIAGEAGDDTIDAGHGNDSITGGTGADSIAGNAGEDTILGGVGADSIDGGASNDSIIAGADNDTVLGSDGDDTIYGNAGEDSLVTGAGNDTVYGGDDADTIEGTSGNNFLSGDNGDDTITGGSGSDTVAGGLGDDSLIGGAGVDVIDYSTSTTALDLTLGLSSDTVTLSDDVLGDDIVTGFEGMIGGTQDDRIIGNSENNIIGGGAGNDTLDGAGGTDTLDLSNASATVIVDLSQGEPGEVVRIADGQGGTDSIVNFENVTGGAASDILTGNSAANILRGNGGFDTISGDSGNDTIYGGDGQDSLLGGDGNDSIEGGDGNDTLDGGAGNDHLRGFNDNDSLSGGEGNDRLDGDDGNDTLLGGTGNDSIYAGNGDDTLLFTFDGAFDRYYGQGGIDTLSFAGVTEDITLSDFAIVTYELSFRIDGNIDYYSGIERVILGEGNDTISVQWRNYRNDLYFEGGAGDDTLFAYWSTSTSYMSNDTFYGGDGDDVLVGYRGEDALYGDAGNDTIFGSYESDVIFGGSGDDIISGERWYFDNDTTFGAANDTLDGGDGIDALDLSVTTDAVNIDLSTNWQGVISYTHIGTDTVRNFEGVIGGKAQDSIIGSDGDDIIGGGSQTDTLEGGLGNDILTFALDRGAAQVDLTAGTANDGYGFNDVISGFEHVSGSAYNDTLKGDAGANVLRGERGNDTIIATSGNDTYYGGADTDTLDFSDLASGVTLDTVMNTATDGTNEYTVDKFEVFTLTALDDVVKLSVDTAHTTITAGDGSDTLSYESVSSDISVAFTFGGTTQANWTTSSSTTHRYTSVEKFIAGSGNDALSTASGNAYFDGGAGNDTLSGGTGADTLIGGAGNDLITLSAGDDVLDGGEGIDVLNLSSVTDALTIDLSGSWQGTLTLTNLGTNTVSNFEGVIGGTGDDSITGTSGDDIIGGGDGTDTLDGGDGNDTLTFANETSAVTVDLGAGTVTDAYSNSETITGFETVIGGSGADRLTGSENADRLEGSAGNDTFIGSAGSDTIVGGTGTDYVSYQGYTGDLIIDLANQKVTKSDGSIDILIDIEYVIGADGNDVMLGDNANNSIQGGAGNDTITAASGQDSVYGNDGDDLFIDTAGNTDYYYGGNGLDIVDFSYATSRINEYWFYNGLSTDWINVDGTNKLYSSVEGFILGSGNDVIRPLYSDSVYLDGRAGNDYFEMRGSAEDTLIGGSGNDSLYGNNGNDVLSGGADDDYIDGGNDQDTIYGGSGNDSLNAGSGNDTIYGEDGNDTINGQSGNNYLFGGSGADTITGGSGNDTIAGGAGDDVINGGSGIDVIDLSGAASAVTIDFSSSYTISINDLNLGNDTVSNIEGVLGSAGDDSMTGGANADVFGGGLGDDTLDGGDGVDTLDFSQSTSAINFSIATNIGAVVTVADGLGGTDSVTNFENVTGGSAADTFTGDDNANVISGNAGNDTLTDGGGQDTLYGGDGDDTFIISGTNNTATESVYGGSGMDIIDLSAMTTGFTAAWFYVSDDRIFDIYTTEGGRIRYSNLEGIIGGTGNDTLRANTNFDVYIDGNDGNDLVDGSNGSDTLVGGTGVDTVNGGNGDDLIVFASDSVDNINGGNGNDTIQFNVSESLDFTAATLANINNVEIFSLAEGNQDITLSGANVLDFVTSNNSVVDNTDYQNKLVLVIDSTDGSDSLTLSGDNWVDTGDTTTVNGEGSFSVYYDSDNDVYVITDIDPGI